MRRQTLLLGTSKTNQYTALAPGALRLDPTELKPWPEIFQTTDKAVVEASCADDDFTLEWKANDGIRISNAVPAMRVHPLTKQEIWSNHAQVFHPSTAYQEYMTLASYTKRWTFYLWAMVAFVLLMVSRLVRKEKDFPMNTVFGDESIISDSDMRIVRDVIWKHTINNPWQIGDVVYIDNKAVSHGRLPYGDFSGKQRKVLVAWSAE